MAKSPIKTYKKKDGTQTYYFRVRIGGKVTTRRGFLTKRLAEVAYFNLKQLYYDNRIKELTGEGFTYEELYSEWLKSYRNKVREQTYIQTKLRFKYHILPFLGKKIINKITLKDCQNAVDEWVNNLSDYRTQINYASQIFKLALKYDYINSNPFDKVDIPIKTRHNEALKHNHEKHGNNFFTKEELAEFLQAANIRDFKYYVFFRLLAFSGMRRGEILALSWKDIDYETNYLTISKSTNYKRGIGQGLGPTKNGETRKIILDQKTVDTIKDWEKWSKDHHKYNPEIMFASFFQNKKGRYYDNQNPRHWQQTILKDMNWDSNRIVTIHGFRHTHAVLLYDMNPEITPKDVQKRLGHATAEFTMNVYEHVTENSDEKITKALNNIDENNRDYK